MKTQMAGSMDRRDELKTYDVAVIGGGASGCMAAIRAAQLGVRVLLVERNDSIGRKIKLTGKGRCNLTNSASTESIIKKFGPGGEFFRTALFSFSNEDLIDLFRSNGLEIKIERQGRAFPVTDDARSVVFLLEKILKDTRVDIVYGVRVSDIEKAGGIFSIISNGPPLFKASRMIIASGGASYKDTGSSGDGFAIAKRLGHTITPLRGALVPLRTKELCVKDLQGLSLENVRITFHIGGKKLSSDVGDLIFTHFGISGPLVLDMSGDVVHALDKYGEAGVDIDLKPGLRREQLESKLVNKFALKGNVQMKNLMQDILPKRMVPVFLSAIGIDQDKRTNQITKSERRAIMDSLKAFHLTVTGSLPVEEAMVTAGGVSKREINPRTMESKLVSGLYFAGEVIEGAAPSGGYNLQQAFSTGYLAGQEAANAA